MARAALGWSVRDLAREARLGVATVNRFEVGTGTTNRNTVAHLRDTFERNGIIFIEANGGGPGVRLRADPNMVGDGEGDAMPSDQTGARRGPRSAEALAA
jgi:hypothetical protein